MRFAKVVSLYVAAIGITGSMMFAQQTRPATTQSAQTRPATTQPAAFNKVWAMEDLIPHLDEVDQGHDFKRSEAMYDRAGCGNCHNMAGHQPGYGVGPDLTSVAARYPRLSILESIIKPSAVISSQYSNTAFRLKNGDSVVGRVVERDDAKVVVMPNMTEPEKTETIKADDITVEKESPLSPMPEGLLNSFTREEIMDLLAFLDAAGLEDQPNFKK